MAKCDSCGMVILFGAIKENGFHFCSKPCASKGAQTIKAGEAILKSGQFYAFYVNWVLFGITYGYVTNYAKRFEALLCAIFLISNGCVGLYIGVLPFLPCPSEIKIRYNKIISTISIIIGIVIVYFALKALRQHPA